MKERLIKILVKNFFWNDYNIDENYITSKLKEDDKEFKKLLISKVLYSNFASLILKNIFSIEELKEMLPQESNNTYISYRLKIIRSILFGEEFEGLRKWQ